MILVVKAVLLLAFELIIEYLFGTMLSKLVLKRENNPGLSLLLGFMGYQAFFQVISLAVTLTTGVFQHLVIAWAVCLIVFVPFSFFYSKRTWQRQLKETLFMLKQQKWLVILAAGVVIALCYYVAINGEQNEDAQYYIGLMTTTIDTNSLFRYNVYTGLEMDSLYLRRALATFEIHSAVLSQLFGIHPLIVARIFRACQNVILTSVAVFLCSKTIFWKEDMDGVEKAILAVVVFWMIQIPFSKTIYVPSTFLLYRAYEAKAFTANFVVLLGLYLCIKMLRERKFTTLLMVGLFMWGSLAMSTSAFIVAGTECALLLLPVWTIRWVEKRKQEKLHAGN